MKKVVFFLLVAITLASCASTSRDGPEQKRDALDEAQDRLVRIETEEQDFDTGSGGKKSNAYERVAVIPTIMFTGRGVKVELEAMFLTSFTVFNDAKASSGYAARADGSSSKAQFYITLPIGHYECLLNEKAFDSAHSIFAVSIDGTSYSVYPSDPPLGTWEMTTRAPIYFDVNEEKSIPVTITSSVAGVNLDYIQFVRIK